jgi:hypothetical protein
VPHLQSQQLQRSPLLLPLLPGRHLGCHQR